MKKIKKHAGFTFVELIFIILVVSLVTISVSQMLVFTSKSRTVVTEAARSGEYATTVMEQFVAESKNDTDRFWNRMSVAEVGTSTNTLNGDVYHYTFIPGTGCSRLCGSLKIGVTTGGSGGQYQKDRYFSAIPSPTPTPCAALNNSCGAISCCPGVVCNGANTTCEVPTPTPTPVCQNIGEDCSVIVCCAHLGLTCDIGPNLCEE